MKVEISGEFDATRISEYDAKRFFGLSTEHLDLLWGQIKIHPSSRARFGYSTSKPRYWLFQVFEFCKAHGSRAAAEEGLYMFKTKNTRRLPQILHKQGLSLIEDCDS
jgi:hypothetical protein